VDSRGPFLRRTHKERLHVPFREGSRRFPRQRDDEQHGTDDRRDSHRHSDHNTNDTNRE